MDWLALLKPWMWPEYIVKWLKGIQELREAKAKANQAEGEYRQLKKDSALQDRKRSGEEFEIEVQQMMRNIRKLQAEEQAKNPNLNIATKIEPGPHDDTEVFNEAMRRIRVEKRR